MKGVYSSVKGSVVDAGSRALARSSMLAAAHGAVWKWRLALRDECVHARVGTTKARFDVSTRSELVRATELGGERHVLAALLDDLEGEEVVWDVGACVGTYACLVANALSSSRLVAFEPEPSNRDRLRGNLGLNAPRERWTVSPVALFDRDGHHTLVSEFEEVGAGHHFLGAAGDGPAVVTRRGDTLIDGGLPAPSVVKVDVQGAEGRVLDGMGDALDEVDVVYVEVHPGQCRRYDTTAGGVEATLRGRGFSLETLGGPSNRRTGVYYVRASR